MMARYTCTYCGIISDRVPTKAEASQLLATHMQVRHGGLGRGPQPAVIPRTGSRRVRRR
ncbi:hypothetical protein [Frankia sp. CcWB3]